MQIAHLFGIAIAICVQANYLESAIPSVSVQSLNKLYHASKSESDEHVNTIKTLQQKIQNIQNNKKNDIVFLIDSSSSVGNRNFRSEVKFVRKILNSLNVSFNFTRVAVVPFSSAKKEVSVFVLLCYIYRHRH